MRNEIFKKISQNRIKYFRELQNLSLKTSEPKLLVDINLSKDTYGFGNKNIITYPAVLKVGLKFPVFSPIMAEKINTMIVKIRNAFGLFGQRIQYLNKNVNNRSDKIAEGLYNAGSRFFEDKYIESDITNPNIGGLTLNVITTRNYAWDFAYPHNYKLAEPISISRIKEKLTDKLIKIARGIILRFEEDLNIGKIVNSSSLKQTESNVKIVEVTSFINPIKKKTFYFFETLSKIHTKTGLKKAFTINTHMSSLINYVKEIKINKFFPCINKFI